MLEDDYKMLEDDYKMLEDDHKMLEDDMKAIILRYGRWHAIKLMENIGQTEKIGRKDCACQYNGGWTP